MPLPLLWIYREKSIRACPGASENSLVASENQEGFPKAQNQVRGSTHSHTLLASLSCCFTTSLRPRLSGRTPRPPTTTFPLDHAERRLHFAGQQWLFQTPCTRWHKTRVERGEIFVPLQLSQYDNIMIIIIYYIQQVNACVAMWIIMDDCCVCRDADNDDDIGEYKMNNTLDKTYM